MAGIDEEIEEVKKKLVDLIIVHLEANQIEPEKAKQLASDFLAVLPVKDHKDLLEKLKNLGEKYPEAKEIYVDEIVDDAKTKDNEALNQMRNHISTGNIEQAIAIAKSRSGGVKTQ